MYGGHDISIHALGCLVRAAARACIAKAPTSGALRRQVRAYILATISHTCRRVGKGTLAECLRLEGAALEALVRRPWSLGLSQGPFVPTEQLHCSVVVAS